VSEGCPLEDEFFEESLNAICLAPLRLLTASSVLVENQKDKILLERCVFALIDAYI